MIRRRWLLAGAAVALPVAGVLWYLFRPELLFIDRVVHEELPAGAQGTVAATLPEPAVLTRGRFVGLAHETSGTAAIYGFPDGRRVLRLTGFETSNGPDVRVYLVAAPDARDDATVTRAGFVDLGEMKGNRGDQNYEVARDLDLTRYRAVSIWCRRFGVNFGTAALAPVAGD